ncbi:hypothetical protein [Legionella sp. km772]|uniref:hypothetical protein n=1 Tax=Legionella sp. km772 TaxID=2498111 RepID=UPI000F8D1D88|nr:hypothetical protein [Legionella sp. km772]RUR13183.1 hypothetical protein ELY15_02945 [Legionella sp. km772]
MPIYKIKSPVILFNHNDYGTRLLFQQGEVNPRNEIGKMGVGLHGWFSSLFYKTITIEATLINEMGRKDKQRFLVNRNSLIKYLGKAASATLNDEALIDLLHQKMIASTNLNQVSDEDKKKQSAAGEHLRHAGEHNQRSLSFSFWDSLVGRFLSWLYQKTVVSLDSFKKRFIFVRNEKELLEAGEILAKARFHEAYAEVPAYKQHMLRYNGKIVDTTTLRDIPITNKENYIKYQKYDSDTHKYGKYPAYGKVDTSTGTTGKATAWVRGDRELEVVKKTLELAEKAQFGNRKISYINAFALGPWATGLTAFEAMRNTGSVFATGPDNEKILDEILRITQYEQRQLQLEVSKFRTDNPNVTQEQGEVISSLITNIIRQVLKNRQADLEEVLEQQITKISLQNQQFINRYKDEIIELSKKLNAEKTQILITGYPPFLKDFAAYVKMKGYKLSEFSLISIVGGQAISEAMRDILIRDGFNDIYSSYGASDLDVNLGSETDDEIIVRKAIENNPGLARELYGVNKGLPMVFHYDPMNNHVECDNTEQSKDDLIFTTTRNDRSSPRIRYNLGDKGRIYAASDVQALLAKYGIFHKPKTPFPLMFIWGRDSTVVFNGANLAFTELERAVADLDTDGQILKKAFYSYQDAEGNDKLEFWLELNDEVDLFDDETMRNFAQQLITKLVGMNQDFRYQVEHLNDGTELPMVRFFKRGQSPISEAGGHRKQVLVFQKENLPEHYNFPNPDQCRGVSLLMSRSLLAESEENRASVALP